MSKPILVLKIGTASITKENGDLDQVTMVEVARQLAKVHSKYNIVLVSSGAVGTGKNFIKNYQGSITEKKAAAAIGNPLLVNKYAQFFAPYEIAIAQSLCERGHFTNKKQFQQLKQTFEELWANDIIPIANENDVVSDLELRFSDNDELATLIALGFGASILLFATSVPGVYDAQNNIIPEIESIDEEVLGLARKEKSTLGLGGMSSKLTFARLATIMGIKTVIFGNRTNDSILKAIRGEHGTICHPHKGSAAARKKWLASGNLVIGKVRVGDKAHKRLSKGAPILASDVKEILADFEKGEIIEILNSDERSFAVARTEIASRDLREDLENKTFKIADTDDLVLL